jgi:hypothetical protein
MKNMKSSLAMLTANCRCAELEPDQPPKPSMPCMLNEKWSRQSRFSGLYRLGPFSSDSQSEISPAVSGASSSLAVRIPVKWHPSSVLPAGFARGSSEDRRTVALMPQALSAEGIADRANGQVRRRYPPRENCRPSAPGLGRLRVRSVKDALAAVLTHFKARPSGGA